MAADDEAPSDQLVEEFLRYLRGRGPRPRVAGAPADALGGVEDLFRLLEAIADTGEIDEPPLDGDPVARRLGLVAPRHDPDADPIAVSLAELAHRMGGELTVVLDPVADGDPLPVRAECRTLGEVVLVCTTGDDDFGPLPSRLASVFARRPTTSAVAVVSSVSLLAVVLTEADCVRAIDPLVGWADPALPSAPEPFGLALGRYLERSVPRWEAVAHLDDMLVLAEEGDEVRRAAERALAAERDRPVRIPAKREARRRLADLVADDLVAVVEDVRAGRLRGDGLVGRVRELAGAGAP